MRAWGEAGLITGAAFAFYVGWEIVSPVFPLYGLEAGASLVEVGASLSLLSLATLLVRLPMGFAAGGFGGRPVLAFACTLQAASLLLLSRASSPAWLLLAVTFFGVSRGSFGPPAASAALNLADEGGRGVAAGRFYTAIGLAMFLGPLLTGIMVRVFSLRQLFLLISVLPVFSLLALSGPWAPPSLYASRADGARDLTARHLINSLKDRKASTVYAVTVLFFICEGVFSTLFPVYASRELLISLSAIGLLFASFGGVNALIRIPSGMVSDAVGRRRPLLLSYLLAIGAFLILSGTDRLPMLVAGMMLYGAAWGLRVPPSSALLGDVVEPRELPIAMAILWMAADLGYAVGAGLAGPIGTLIPFPTIVRSMTLVLGFCAALILLGLEDR